MKEFTFAQAQKLSSPSPFALVCALEEDGRTNLACFSWWTFLSNSPASLLFCAKHGRYTAQCAARASSFALCLVGEAIKDAAFRCGTVSGQRVHKADAFGIELFPCRDDGLMAPCASRLVFVCRLTQVIPLGDHDLCIGEVERVFGDPEARQLYAFDGYARLDALPL